MKNYTAISAGTWRETFIGFMLTVENAILKIFSVGEFFWIFLCRYFQANNIWQKKSCSKNGKQHNFFLEIQASHMLLSKPTRSSTALFNFTWAKHGKLIKYQINMFSPTPAAAAHTHERPRERDTQPSFSCEHGEVHALGMRISWVSKRETQIPSSFTFCQLIEIPERYLEIPLNSSLIELFMPALHFQEELFVFEYLIKFPAR
jgi:hypothetical protein